MKIELQAERKPTARCDLVGCELKPTHQVIFLVYSKGLPKRAPNFVTLTFGVYVCRYHANAGIDPREWFHQEGRETIAQAMIDLGCAPLDFDAAEFRPRQFALEVPE